MVKSFMLLIVGIVLVLVGVLLDSEMFMVYGNILVSSSGIIFYMTKENNNH